jgi:Activator of Hsp90 ATPase homolog 1-like protein
VFVDEMPSWWPLAKFSASAKRGKRAKRLVIEPKQGGQIVELSEDESEHLWGTIKRYEPFGYVAMDLHIGLPAETASLVEVRFTPLEPERTRVELTQSEWERFGEFAEMMLNGYPRGWIAIFDEAYFEACSARAKPS